MGACAVIYLSVFFRELKPPRERPRGGGGIYRNGGMGASAPIIKSGMSRVSQENFLKRLNHIENFIAEIF
jgi:hypothetical protein